MTVRSSKNVFDYLARMAEKRGIQVVLPLYGKGEKKTLRIEAFSKSRLVEYEKVKAKESVHDAAMRMYARMKKDRVIE